MAYIDEIKKFIDSRYVSAIEAAWRLFSFEMNEKSHVVQRLDIHLEKDKRVYFNNNDLEKKMEKAESKNSQLEAFFELNKNSP